MISISVIICSYNPQISLLIKVLNAIQTANKKHAVYEIILVDNNSLPPISEYLETKENFLDNHIKVIVEPKQGLTYARLCGIKNSSGKLLIFVDDDNIIREDYFLEASKIYTEYSYIGAYSGQVELIFDKAPPEWTKKYWGMLVHRLFTGNYWGNKLFDNAIMPNGAGMCIRREVGEYYLSLHEEGKRVFTLDRSGKSLLSGGDNDFAMCACDLGMGMGLFENLFLKHFIPEYRLNLNYLKRLTYGIEFSSVLLKYMRTSKMDHISWKRRIYNKVRTLFLFSYDRTMVKYSDTGYNDAIKYIKRKKVRVQ